MEKQGFTLVELLVVIAVLAVLATSVMIFINPAKRFKQANDARIKADINQIAKALMAHYTIRWHYPTAAEGGLAALVADSDLRTSPSPPPGGAANYSYNANGACGVSPYSGCEATLYYALRNPLIAGNVWCWQSKTGTATEIATCPVP